MTSSKQPSSQPRPSTRVTGDAEDPAWNARSAPRDVSALSMLSLNVPGAMFDYEIPNTEEAMASGWHASGLSPTHILVRGTPSAGSSRCAWHDTVMTNAQRQHALLQIHREDLAILRKEGMMWAGSAPIRLATGRGSHAKGMVTAVSTGDGRDRRADCSSRHAGTGLAQIREAVG